MRIISNKAAFVYVVFQSPGPDKEKIEEEVATLLGYLEGQASTALLPAPRKVEIREISDPLNSQYIFSSLTAYAIASLTTDLETGKKSSPDNLDTKDWELSFEHLQTTGKKFENVQVAWLITQKAPPLPSFLDAFKF